MLNSNEILSSGIFDFKVFSFSENLLEAGTGNNGQQILLFLGGPDAETNRTFLGKVMTAVGVTIQEDSFTIPVPDSSPFLFANLASEKGCQTAIFFGIQPQQAGLHLSVAKYQPIKVGATILPIC